MHDRGKGLLAEGLHHSRTGIEYRLISKFPVGLLQGLRAPAPQNVIEKERQILPVIVSILFIGRCRQNAAASASQMLSKEIAQLSGDHGLKACSAQVLCSTSDDALKADRIDKTCPLPDRQIFARHFKADPEPLCPGIRHPGDCLFIQALYITPLVAA